ncbi:isochorismatase family protein [Mollicutes bacterium LVI A0078]|nr:isochorismatase family protein [Mollicutes bacterium LVI A0075]WOO91015.1 isochorismatase family protein [Mollicutes bacterium LVI A0078]
MKNALFVIDIQNEYSPKGGLPVLNFEHIISSINQIDTDKYDLVISVRHVNETGLFSNNWNISYPNNYKLNYDYEIIKQTADSFDVKNLAILLSETNIDSIDICGMMTQNCVTYTALSASQLGFEVRVLSDFCTTIDQTVNTIALRALQTKVTVI